MTIGLALLTHEIRPIIDPALAISRHIPWIKEMADVMRLRFRVRDQTLVPSPSRGAWVRHISLKVSRSLTGIGKNYDDKNERADCTTAPARKAHRVSKSHSRSRRSEAGSVRRKGTRRSYKTALHHVAAVRAGRRKRNRRVMAVP